MGLHLLISPSGYRKTTLMEYVANRLGLVFIKINGPSLGHSVVSLDPNEAPNATARQEVDKVNLALEMGNNAMLNLDDSQHTHPEFQQKFISLCDAQRRIEGVWQGRTRTYDLRGKKFCVVMAGNPYTESSDRFQIPDMLANRADTYNLGDTLSGRDDGFTLSFMENAPTSTPTLAPLAARSQSDVNNLIDLAAGTEVQTSDLEHDYSALELTEVTDLLNRMAQRQRTSLMVNAEHIRSASVEEEQLAGVQYGLGDLGNAVKAAGNHTEVAQALHGVQQALEQPPTLDLGPHIGRPLVHIGRSLAQLTERSASGDLAGRLDALLMDLKALRGAAESGALTAAAVQTLRRGKPWPLR
jgi:hypothetical protein